MVEALARNAKSAPVLPQVGAVVAIDALFPHASANAAQVGPSVSIAISRWFHRAWRE